MSTGTVSQLQTMSGRSSARRGYFATKRVVDVAVSVVCLVVLSPVLLVIAIAIVIDSRGPVIFRQERVRGHRVRDGERWESTTFKIWKFRTMVAGADAALHQDYITAYIRDDRERLDALRPNRAATESFRPAHDPRVTRVGRVLRASSLDELPQLWNVVRGDMSLVGPRPPLPYEVALYSEHDRRRLTTPQGITGWAQIKGRCSVGFADLVARDLEYIDAQSLWFDLKVLAMTVPAVLSRKGAD